MQFDRPLWVSVVSYLLKAQSYPTGKITCPEQVLSLSKGESRGQVD